MKSHIQNMFATIKNGQLAKRDYVIQQRTSFCESFLKVLWKEGFIRGYEINHKKTNQLKIFLKYKNDIPVIKSAKTISKPGRRVYYSLKQIWKIDSSKVFIIFSTNLGLKSINDCKKLKVGGEPFLLVN